MQYPKFARHVPIDSILFSASAKLSVLIPIQCSKYIKVHSPKGQPSLAIKWHKVDLFVIMVPGLEKEDETHRCCPKKPRQEPAK